MKQFDFSRFLRCLKWILKQDRVYFLVGIISIIAVFFILIFTAGNMNTTRILLNMAYVVFCFLVSILYMIEKPDRRLRMLMMPFSNSEKYLSYIVIYILGMPLVLFAGELFIDLLHWSYYYAIGQKTEWLTPLFMKDIAHVFCFWKSPTSAGLFSLVLFSVSLCLLIGFSFRKVGFFVGILCTILIIVIFILIDNPIATVVVSLPLSVLAIMASYHIFCKIQLITRKWLQI